MKVSTINKALVVEYIFGAVLVFLAIAMCQEYRTLGAILMLEGWCVIGAVSILFSIALSPDYGWLKITNEVKNGRIHPKIVRVE